MDADHLPVAGGGVLSGGGEGRAAEGGLWSGRGRKACERLAVAQAEAAHVRQMQGADAGDVPQGVTAGVTVGRGVRHLPDADAVEHDPDDAAEHFLRVAALGGCGTATAQSIGMAVKLNRKAYEHAQELVKEGRSC